MVMDFLGHLCFRLLQPQRYVRPAKEAAPQVCFSRRRAKVAGYLEMIISMLLWVGLGGRLAFTRAVMVAYQKQEFGVLFE